ncbi:hypothetical protein D3C78_749460 [compost metagenome]
MLGIASGATVTAAEDLPLVEQGVDHHHAGLLDMRDQHLGSLLLGLDAGMEELSNTGLHVHQV